MNITPSDSTQLDRALKGMAFKANRIDLNSGDFFVTINADRTVLQISEKSHEDRNGTAYFRVCKHAVSNARFSKAGNLLCRRGDMLDRSYVYKTFTGVDAA